MLSGLFERISQLLSGLKARPADEGLLDQLHEHINDAGVDFYRAVIQQFGIVPGHQGKTTLSSAQESGDGVTRQTWQNCVANQVAQPLKYFKPASLDQLRSILVQARTSGCRVRAIGSGHSFSDVALTSDFMIDTHALNRPLNLEPELLKDSVDTTHLFRTECGILIRDLNTALDDKGLALENMGGYDGQTIAGVISTATHGSGITLGALSSSVASLLLITADNRLMQIEPGDGITDPAKFQSAHPDIELKQDDDWFHSVAVSMGCMGVIYSVTLGVRDKYWLMETREMSTWDRVKADLMDRAVLRDNRHYEVVVNPYPIDGTHSCLVTRRNETGRRESDNPFKERHLYTDLISELPAATEALLFLFDEFPQLTPRIIDSAMKQLEDTGYVNPSYKVLNLGGANYISAYSSETAFPMDTCLAAAEKIFDIAARSRDAGNLYHTSPFSLRFVKASEDYLAMQHGRDTCMLEIPMINGTIGGHELLAKYESAFREFNGRPHWGQMHFRVEDRPLLGSMYPKLDQWLAVYHQLNATGTFSNIFTEKYGL